MKILKNSLVILLFTIFGCSSDQNNLDIITEEERVNTYQTNSVSEYSLEEILNGMRKWDNLRTNKSAVYKLFHQSNSLNLNIGYFPQGSALHAYACILNGKLKFAIISEVYDKVSYKDSINNYIKVVDVNYTDISQLRARTYQNYNFPLPTQYIQATDAINRIEDWNANYPTWLNNTTSVYQGFDIPTYSLAAQNYIVYFGLKNNLQNPNVKDADLVFYNNNGLFYDAVQAYPPLIHQTKYYLLGLI